MNNDNKDHWSVYLGIILLGLMVFWAGSKLKRDSAVDREGCPQPDTIISDSTSVTNNQKISNE